jgi:3-oxoadipate enol-lactonase
VERWLSADFRVARPETAAQIEDMLCKNDPRGYAACCAAMRDADLRDAIRRAPSRPALVIVGDADASAPPARGAALAASLPDARLVTLKSAHLSCVEAETAFLSTVMAFLVSSPTGS